MKKWQQKYAANIQSEELYMISIHTVFEGHHFQNPIRLRTFVKEKQITHPVAIDRHTIADGIPETMKRYQTRGTPEMAIIDKKGLIRFQHIGSFDTLSVERLIDRLLEE